VKAVIDLDKLWKNYKETKDEELRKILVEHYLKLVKYIAGRVAINLPMHIDKNDLILVGVIGLIDAIEKFDINSGVKFETYASLRIRGSIIDELRAMDWIPRSTRKKIHKLEIIMRELEDELGRSPSDEEIAKAMGVSIHKLGQIFADASGTTLISLDMKNDKSDNPTELLDSIKDKKFPSPSANLEYEDVKKLLADAIELLPDQERNVLALYYYERMILKEIGMAMNISESRVSQIHTKAILQLRMKLQKMRENFIL